MPCQKRLKTIFLNRTRWFKIYMHLQNKAKQLVYSQCTSNGSVSTYISGTLAWDSSKQRILAFKSSADIWTVRLLVPLNEHLPGISSIFVVILSYDIDILGCREIFCHINLPGGFPMLPVQININMSPSRIYIEDFKLWGATLRLVENDVLLFWSVLVEVLLEPRMIFEVTCVSVIIVETMKIKIPSGLEGESEIDFLKRISEYKNNDIENIFTSFMYRTALFGESWYVYSVSRIRHILYVHH